MWNLWRFWIFTSSNFMNKKVKATTVKPLYKTTSVMRQPLITTVCFWILILAVGSMWIFPALKYNYFLSRSLKDNFSNFSPWLLVPFPSGNLEIPFFAIINIQLAGVRRAADPLPGVGLVKTPCEVQESFLQGSGGSVYNFI